MMKIFITLVLLALTASAQAEDFVKATKVKPSRDAKFFYQANPVDTCRTSPPGTSYCFDSNTQCTKGGKLYVCTDTYKATEPVACTEPTPYCTGSNGYAKCTAFPERFCETSSNYRCPGVGYYPDLYDCLKFYECYYDAALKKIVPQQFACSTGYPFAPNGILDYKCLPGGRCVVPQCRSTIAAEWVPLNYTGYEDALAVYCLNGRPQYVFSCPPGLSLNTWSISNSESPYCEINCKNRPDLTRAPFINDNTRYYECRGGIAYEVLCSRGKVYDPYERMCNTMPA